MFQLAQVNVGTNSSTIIGLSYLILAVTYIFLMVGWLVLRKNALPLWARLIYILQGVLLPVIMLVSGIILMFQGWRLDPVIQFQQLLLLLVIIYLSFKDIIINLILRMRKSKI